MPSPQTSDKYQFTELSLEGTYIRAFSVVEGRWGNVNLKQASHDDFDRWVRAFFKRNSLELDESEFQKSSEHSASIWTIKERTEVCQFLFDSGLLTVLVDYLESI